ncbi:MULTISPECIES: hypothetical protein [unclassified Streptomyces]|uniref:Uncharacterized protein n=1 Tax=Streptomyces sp. NBC_00060 TaxID=2975636 RepID=A0AAU2HBL2_9ACTN
MQTIQARSPAVHLVNRDIPTHDWRNERLAGSHVHCGCSTA